MGCLKASSVPLLHFPRIWMKVWISAKRSLLYINKLCRRRWQLAWLIFPLFIQGRLTEHWALSQHTIMILQMSLHIKKWLDPHFYKFIYYKQIIYILQIYYIHLYSCQFTMTLNSYLENIHISVGRGSVCATTQNVVALIDFSAVCSDLFVSARYGSPHCKKHWNLTQINLIYIIWWPTHNEPW